MYCVSNLRSEFRGFRFEPKREVPEIIARLISKCLWKRMEIASCFFCCPVNCECSWKKTQVEKKINSSENKVSSGHRKYIERTKKSFLRSIYMLYSRGNIRDSPASTVNIWNHSVSGTITGQKNIKNICWLLFCFWLRFFVSNSYRSF